MLGFVAIAFLAAFGLVCTVWTLLGFCIPKDQGSLLYRGAYPVAFARRYLWLREMGLLRCPLTVVNPPEADVSWLRDRAIDVFFGDPEERTGEKTCESGNGDYPGRDQRRSLSEL